MPHLARLAALPYITATRPPRPLARMGVAFPDRRRRWQLGSGGDLRLKRSPSIEKPQTLYYFLMSLIWPSRPGPTGQFHGPKLVRCNWAFKLIPSETCRQTRVRDINLSLLIHVYTIKRVNKLMTLCNQKLRTHLFPPPLDVFPNVDLAHAAHETY